MVETFVVKLPAIIGGFAVKKQILVLKDFCLRKLFIIIQIHFFNQVKSLKINGTACTEFIDMSIYKPVFPQFVSLCSFYSEAKSEISKLTVNSPSPAAQLENSCHTVPGHSTTGRQLQEEVLGVQELS